MSKNKIKKILFLFTDLLSSIGLNKKIIMSGFNLKRNLPINIVASDILYFNNEITRSFGAVELVTAQNAYLVVNEGLAIKNMHILSASLISEEMRHWYGFEYLLNAYKNSYKLPEENYLLVYNHYGGGYGHWLADVVPRLFVIKREIGDFKILLPESYNTFHLQTLEPFGLTINNIKYLKLNQSYNVPNLSIVSHVGSSCNTNEKVLQQLRVFYLDYYHGKNWPISTRKIYISRSRQKNRKVINTEETDNLLVKLGFEIIYPEDYNFEAQVKLFASCKVMVGLTGSGLTNMLFMQKGGAVVEFKMKEDYQNLHYFSMSSGMELDYYYSLCEVEGEDRFTANFYVNLQELEKIVASIVT